MLRILFLSLLIAWPGFVCAACAQSREKKAAAESVPVYTYEVINTFPHDPDAFTQGLIYYDGALYESTGRYGKSSLRQVDLKTGEVLKKISVPDQFFAEGMTIFGGKIFQLTWVHKRGFVYDLKSFDKLSEFTYDGEGWGLTTDGHVLILSDGTNRIRFLDPQTFKVTKTISVFDAGVPLKELNELEFIKGEIYANIWQTDRIVRINPATGNITGWIDLTGLLKPENDNQHPDVLNGIAYDEAHDRLFVTGKLWPKLFEIRLK